ncbi:MAG TPA: acyl-protein synthetase [Sphingomicrobium sp.]|nr:acyl-protein synthetase [Sphingomicrobium sp.]
MIAQLAESLAAAPYSLNAGTRERLMLGGVNALTEMHYERCVPYQRIVHGYWGGKTSFETLEEVPYLPVSIFKTQLMQSVPDSDVKLTLTSSGTTGQAVSRIPLDAESSSIQQRALASSLRHVLGNERLPMLVIDTDQVFKDPKMMSARGAGVLGLMRYGRSHSFALRPTLEPDVEEIKRFLDHLEGRPFFMFGFTFLVWTSFYEKLRDEGLDLSAGVLIHSGGWKKMAERAVGNSVFRAALGDAFGLTRIHNFYGMVEQIGSIFLEGPEELLYPPNFADLIIRDPRTLEPLPNGSTGLVQLFSLLPHSYPGHSILTEDLGAIESVSTGTDGWAGKGLRIEGRLPRAEVRGCSDVIGMAA